jgi:hypothetical protein
MVGAKLPDAGRAVRPAQPSRLGTSAIERIRSRAVPKRIAALVAVSTVLGGCGTGTKSETGQVSAVAHRWFSAFADGNGSELCSLMTDEAKQRLIHTESFDSGGSGRRANCSEAVKTLHEGVIREAREAGRSDPLAELREVKVTVLSQSGQKATARVTLPAGDVTDVPLSKTAAGWLISGQARCVPVAKSACLSSP